MDRENRSAKTLKKLMAKKKTSKKANKRVKSFFKNRSLAIVFFVLSLSFILFNVFYRQIPLMMIEAQSRSVEYTILNSEAGKILFQAPVLLKQSIKGKTQCIQGLFEPEELSIVSYNMFENALIIRAKNDDTKPAAYFIPKDNMNKRIELSSQSSLSYGSQTKCHQASPPPLRLPIWGKTEIGQTPIAPTLSGRIDPFSGLLMSGTVSLFGKNIFGEGLYPAGEFKLPVGARLSSTHSIPWYGYATYVENTDVNNISSLQVSASTESAILNLDRLASGSKTEKIQTSFLTQLTKDPFIASIGLILAGLFFLSEFMLSLKQLWKKDEN